MRICVAGLWHLGAVTAACLAAGGHEVVGFDEDPAVIDGLSAGRPPLFEPGLAELIAEGVASGRLAFTTQATQAIKGADVFWATYDTPVDENDVADVDHVLDRVKKYLPFLPGGSLVLISSQLPVGSTRALAKYFAGLGLEHRLAFGYSPENLRLGQAINVFMKPDRIVVGLDSEAERARISTLLNPFTDNIVFMSIESAEMTKHAINSFLAMSVAYANEIAAVCETVGADADEVARGLKTESRIGPKAYLAPGTAFSGGTLARDISFLSELSQRRDLNLLLIPSVQSSNDRHRAWPYHRLKALLGSLEGRRIALLGLTYKPGTDTLRRSYALELAKILIGAGASVRAFDPVVPQWPIGFDLPITLAGSLGEAVRDADAAVIATEWPEFRNEDWPTLAATMARPILIDPKGHLAVRSSDFGGITYAVVGRTSMAADR